MCSKVTCKKCGKPTWSGCGEHIEEALGAYVVNPEWTVAKIIRHILSSPDSRSSAGAEGL